MSEQSRTTGKRNKKKLAWWAWLLILIAVAALLVAARYVYVMFLNPMSAFETPKPATSPTPTAALRDDPGASPTPTPTLSPEELLRLEEEALREQADMSFMENRVNILMLGWDQSPEREDEDSAMYRDEKNNYRSDVLMLMTVDFSTHEVYLISVPRDTYAPIYNTKGRWKINAAFAKGGSAEKDGFTYAMQTVGGLLGVPIDYYAGVDMSGLKAVVDAMGGVDYDVDVRISLNGRVLEEGFQHLDGQQVLDYCRARKGITGTNSKGANSDVGRADRQQRMLFAIFEQLKSKNQLVNIPKIYASVQDKIYTNLNSEQIAAMAVFALNLNMDDLNRRTLEGEYVNDVYNASFYVLRNDKLKALVKEVFGIEIKTNPRYDLKYVRGDKAASEAMSYVSGAENLLNLLSLPVDATGAYENPPEEVTMLLAALKEAADAAQRKAPATATEEQIEAILDEGLDQAAIDTALTALNQQMYTLCLKYGISKEHVTKKDVPAAFYNLLPDTAPTANAVVLPSASPAIDGGETPNPDPSPSPTPEIDGEVQEEDED